jgi:hypothetical protein
MDPIMANEVAGQTPKKNDQSDSNQYLFIFKSNEIMNKFMELVKKFGKADKLSKDDVEAVKTAFAEIPATDKNARLNATYESIIEKFEETDPVDPKDPEEDPKDPEAGE